MQSLRSMALDQWMRVVSPMSQPDEKARIALIELSQPPPPFVRDRPAMPAPKWRPDQVAASKRTQAWLARWHGSRAIALRSMPHFYAVFTIAREEIPYNGVSFQAKSAGSNT
jgi:hypothetical protein